MSVKAKVSSTQNSSDTSGPFPTSYNTVSSNQNIQFGIVQIASSCWRDHTGGYRVGVVINYSDKEFTYWASESHGWGVTGTGCTWIESIVLILRMDGLRDSKKL